MFTILFQTLKYRPDLQVTIRNNINGWDHDVPGLYQNAAWRFELSELDYPNGFFFKFVLEHTYWMEGNNLFCQPHTGQTFTFIEAIVQFPELEIKPELREILVENSHFQQLFFKPNLDENHQFDVIVIGSGVGGGVVAEQLSDMGVDVLVLEAGSLLFPTHIANLPRQHQLGVFDKHLWSLFDEYKVVNYNTTAGSNYNGAQAFNLGGRSIFWGGFIPRMMWWELEAWPDDIQWYLENAGYQKAEELMYWPSKPPIYQEEIKKFLKLHWPDYNHFDAPMAIRNQNQTFISTGLFSTADLLAESKMTDGNSGKANLSINLNHAAIKIETSNQKATGVTAYDLLAKKYRTFKAKYIILAAGTIESTKLAKMSNLHDPLGLVGTGITDHPIFFTHFSIPEGSPYHSKDFSCKVLSQHKQANTTTHPYNILIELGADLNQGRYLDKDILEQHRQTKRNAMLCEIVFLFNAPLLPQNKVEHFGPSFVKPSVTMQDSPSADAFWEEINFLKNQIIAQLAGEALPYNNLDLKRAGLGGVAHEVGTLRLGIGASGVVDENLQFNGYDNLFVCDLSVFPTSPAANPTLTLAALSIRLSEHLQKLLSPPL